MLRRGADATGARGCRGRRVLRVHDGPAPREPGRRRRRDRGLSARREARPASAEIPAALAELYARLNRPADAIAAGERAVKANPSNPEANWILGSLYARMSEMPNTRDADRHVYTQRAIANLEKANRNAHPSVPMMLGRLYILDGQYEKAIAMLVPFVTDQPDQVEAVALLAEAYQATDRDADAIALLEKSVAGFAGALRTLGQVYQDAGRWQRCRARVSRCGRGAAAESGAARAVGDRAAERRATRSARAKCSKRDRRATRATRARCICCPKRSAARATTPPPK